MPVQHGSRPQLTKKKAPIDFYRQLPFCKEKEKDVFEYVVASASARTARGGV